MKKLLKIIPVFLIALLCAVFFVPNFTKTTSYATTDTKVGATRFSDSSMNVQYAGDVLVGVDKDGYVYRAESGLISDLTKTGTQFKRSNRFANYPNFGTLAETSNPFFAYGNNILLFVGNDGYEDIIYKSTDQGKNWKAIKPGLVKSSNLADFIPFYIEFGNDTFVLQYAVTSQSTQKISNYIFYTSTDGETWTLNNMLKSEGLFSYNYSNGYFIQTIMTDNSLYFRATQDFKTFQTSKTIPDLTDESLERFVGGCSVRINNAFYLFGSSGRVWTTPDVNSEWRELEPLQINSTNIQRINAVIPYNNGAIAISPYTYSIYYIEFEENSLSAEYLFTNSDNHTQYHWGFPYQATFSDKHLTVGASNYYCHGSSNWEYTGASFYTYQRAVNHTVKFVDYNGALLYTAEVADGSTVIAPASPSRTGYKFIGWDKDLTTPITEDTVFTAAYEVNKYTVTFKDDNNNILTQFKVDYNSPIPKEKIPTPTKDNAQFIGWDKDIDVLISGDITFTAKFSNYAYLTFKYPTITGSFGLIDQFYKTSITTKSIRYLIGDQIDNDTYKAFIQENLSAWISDFESDNKWDYDVRFTGWDRTLPTHITEDITITANYEKLNNVRLEYYSQLRFPIENNYYYCFIGYMKIERLLPTGSKINIDDFKREDVNYEIYNASRDVFYNNLVGFKFLNWDKNIDDEVVDDTIIKANYEMPTFNVKYYDADKYLIDETNEEIAFMGIEDLITILNTAKSYTDSFKTLMKNFFSFRFNANLDDIADKVDLSIYMSRVKKYNNKSTLLITPYVVMDTDRPDVYSGIFTNGTIHVDSAVLQKFGGSQESHNMSYWISPIMFVTTAYPMSATVSYTNILDSSIKSAKTFFSAIGGFFVSIWNGLKAAWNVIWKVSIALIIIGLVVFILVHYKDSIKKLSEKRKKQKQEYKSTKKQYKNKKKKGTNKK